VGKRELQEAEREGHWAVVGAGVAVAVAVAPPPQLEVVVTWKTQQGFATFHWVVIRSHVIDNALPVLCHIIMSSQT
jgi:hypothetical protein